MERQSLVIAWICLTAIVLCQVVSAGSARGSAFGVLGPLQHHNTRPASLSLFDVRGGSTAAATDDDTTDPKVEDGGEEEDENEEEDAPKPAAISSKPVKLLIQTNWGNSVLDHRVEMLAARTRNVASLKKSLSRQLPGKPPVLGLELVYEGRVLEDELLVDELFDDEDDEDEDEEEEGEDDEFDGANKVLILNSVPPVDPRFATELLPKLRTHVENDVDTLGTDELVEAYFLNQAAMSRNAQLMANPTVGSSPMLRLEMQEEAKQLEEQLKSQVPEDVWESSLQAVKKTHNMEERRGQRYRSGKGGARTNLKKSVQTNLNIHWGETIRNFLLFLFFGYFGGRNSVSRTLMLWGAPLCFISQARPVKMWTKTLFYMMANPPGIILSLLPAPQQAILTADLEKSYAALYSLKADAAEVAAPGVAPVAAPVAAPAELEAVEEPVDDEDVEESMEEEDTEEDDEDESEDESEEEDYD